MQPFVTNLHHHEPEYHEKRKKEGFYLQGQGHSVGLCNQNMMVSTTIINSEPADGLVTSLV